MATQINFFIHNLAQLKFSSPQAPPTLLTFVPQVHCLLPWWSSVVMVMLCLPRPPQAYSIETDGRISCAVIVAYYMKYYPDAHAVSVQLWTHTNGKRNWILQWNLSNKDTNGAEESTHMLTRCHLHARTVLTLYSRSISEGVPNSSN